MEFKVGDIVRIKGGQDEWEVNNIQNSIISIKFNTPTGELQFPMNEWNLELVRRPNEIDDWGKEESYIPTKEDYE